MFPPTQTDKCRVSGYGDGAKSSEGRRLRLARPALQCLMGWQWQGQEPRFHCTPQARSLLSMRLPRPRHNGCGRGGKEREGEGREGRRYQRPSGTREFSAIQVNVNNTAPFDSCGGMVRGRGRDWEGQKNARIIQQISFERGALRTHEWPKQLMIDSVPADLWGGGIPELLSRGQGRVPAATGARLIRRGCKCPDSRSRDESAPALADDEVPCQMPRDVGGGGPGLG